MANISRMIFFFSIFFSLSFYSCLAQSCADFRFSNGKDYVSCNDLPVLNSSLHWNYRASLHTVDIAFRHAGNDDSRWIAWAINPTSKGMIGSQALVAFRRTDGILAAYTSPITSYGTQLEEGNLSFPVYGVSASYENKELVIFATLKLPTNTTTVNQVWQEGPLQGNVPGMHSLSGPNVQSVGTLDFLSGKTAMVKGVGSSTKLKTVHGALNAISWGFLMPLGVVIARYVKVFKVANPAWFYMHVSCQCFAYLIGVGGGIIGFWLGHKSSGIRYGAHRNIGITILCLATFQVVFAKFFRPKIGHELRVYWNMCHYSIGYGTIILSIINVFKGFDILGSGNMWKTAYIGTLIALGCVSVILETITWYVVLKRKWESSDKNLQGTSRLDTSNDHVVTSPKEEV